MINNNIKDRYKNTMKKKIIEKKIRKEKEQDKNIIDQYWNNHLIMMNYH